MVLWTVFPQPQKVSERQLEVLRGLKDSQGRSMSGNFRFRQKSKFLFSKPFFRNTQPLENRSVFKNKAVCLPSLTVPLPNVPGLMSVGLSSLIGSVITAFAISEYLHIGLFQVIIKLSQGLIIILLLPKTTLLFKKIKSKASKGEIFDQLERDKTDPFRILSRLSMAVDIYANDIR